MTAEALFLYIGPKSGREFVNKVEILQFFHNRPLKAGGNSCIMQQYPV